MRWDPCLVHTVFVSPSIAIPADGVLFLFQGRILDAVSNVKSNTETHAFSQLPNRFLPFLLLLLDF
jgi:hypothetical protein